MPDWLQADELPNGGERMPETKLKPCPFCGGKAYYRTPTHLKGTAFDVMTVECKQCGASPYAVEVY